MPQPPNLRRVNRPLWGVKAIAAHAKTNVRKARYLIAQGVIPVRKLGPKTILGWSNEVDRALGDATAPLHDDDRGQ